MSLDALLRGVFLALLALACTATFAADTLPEILLPQQGIGAHNLVVVVNDRDPLSREMAEYYRLAHSIPAENMVYIEFEPDRPAMSAGEFAVLKRVVESKIPPQTEAYLLAWAEPYKVGCMSISSAFAFGFNRRYCASGCENTALSRYALGASLTPAEDFDMRPTMLLGAQSVDEARALIERGSAARGRFAAYSTAPPAAYLVETPDRSRNVRRVYFSEAVHRFGERLDIHTPRTEAVEGADNILFYFTGARFVKGIASNRYLPGAVADHLTSTGGMLTDSRQMSAAQWLRAGATGSYGTVVEPCNILSKFPNPTRMIEQYLAGRTLIEAYWKSVAMPGQGVFIGDPLAAPYTGYRIEDRGDMLRVHSAQLARGRYQLFAAPSRNGPFRPVGGEIEVTGSPQSFPLLPPYAAVYKLEPVAAAQPPKS
ncbi:TIGR03790 family protein [Mangrovimicrobium sediminis]|uniref:TIGR03790 family protein n=1 Tax=Mangrovimicrobium sediminis TaxID=2562682 RepID=A0A4Z0M5C0_9GAMM|nr:TIGR03790 family protein [Haliea sp. SAOS-164]TGD74852.1 TIGR03790 family protein [Haliea sp. SAOS-164]